MTVDATKTFSLRLFVRDMFGSPFVVLEVDDHINDTTFGVQRSLGNDPLEALVQIERACKELRLRILNR